MILYVYEKLFIIIKRNETQIIEVTRISVCKWYSISFLNYK